MNPLQDLLDQAQQGQFIDNLARTYGISSSQARQAVDAMLPAFAIGLQRSTQTPQGMADLLGTMARNPYAQAFEDAAAGAGPQLRQPGNDALAAMFGSPDVSRAVAAQAAATTGLSSALLKQMLPAIAALVLGGMMKSGGGGLGDLLGNVLGGGAPSQGRAPGGTDRAPGGNPLEDLLGGMFGGGAAGGGRPGSSGSGNPLEDLLGGMLGGGRTAPQGGGANPLDDILGGMFGRRPQSSGQDGSGQEPMPEPDEPAAQPRRGSDPMGDLLGGILGGMFGGATPGRSAPQAGADDPGASAQDPRMQPFQDIFDQFFDKNGRR